MKFIVTAGGTSEKIDEVRKISNMATGKLGSLIADELYKQGASNVEKIYYICEKGAVVPDPPCVETIYTQGVRHVKAELETLLNSDKIDAVIHSMAVSDYSVCTVTSVEKLAESISARLTNGSGHDGSHAQDVRQLIADAFEEKSPYSDTNKIPSDVDDLVLTLRRTPKIIPLFKHLQPDILLVGFKLLSGVSKETLLKAGFDIMRKNQCDFVLANDADSLKDGGQTGFLLSPDGNYETLDGKPAIARRIAQVILKQLESR